MNGIVNTLVRESWNTTKTHWRALAVGTVVSSIIGLLALLPLLPLILTPEAEWQPVDALVRIGLAFFFTMAPALLFETWIAGLAEARRKGEDVDHRAILHRSLTVMPSIIGATSLFLVFWFSLCALAMAPIFLGAVVGHAALFFGALVFMAVFLCLSLVGMILPTFYSVLCAVGYVEGQGPWRSLMRTWSIFRKHRRDTLVLALVCVGISMAASIPLTMLLFPVFFAAGFMVELGTITTVGLVLFGALFIVAIHAMHAAESIVTSHVYPVMRHYGLLGGEDELH